MAEIDVMIDTHGLETKLASKGKEMEARFRTFTVDILRMARNVVQFKTPRAKTGHAKASIKYSNYGNKGMVYASREIAPYIDWVIDGRGVVRPINAKALRFKIYGKVIYAKKVKPSKKNPIFDNAYPQISKNIDIKTTKLIEWMGDL